MMTDKKGAQEETGRHVPLTSETKLAALWTAAPYSTKEYFDQVIRKWESFQKYENQKLNNINCNFKE